MNTITYDVGIWKVEANVKTLGERKRLATVVARTHMPQASLESKHVLVFDCKAGQNETDELRHLIGGILLNRHQPYTHAD